MESSKKPSKVIPAGGFSYYVSGRGRTLHKLPSDNHIRDLLDSVRPEQIFPVIEETLQVLSQQGQLKGFRSFADTLLLAIDGTEYFSSSQIHCPHCSTRQLRSGETTYFHTVVTPVIVCPGQSKVIPLVLEFVTPQDGHDKQDCETAATKRWLLEHGQRYHAFNITVLGDDLYCHQPLCQELLAQQFNFILVCRPESHTNLLLAQRKLTKAVVLYFIRVWASG